MAEQDGILEMLDFSQRARHDEQAQSPGEMQSRYPMLEQQSIQPVQPIKPKRTFARPHKKNEVDEVLRLKQQVAASQAPQFEDLMARGTRYSQKNSFDSPRGLELTLRGVTPDRADKAGFWDPSVYTEQELEQITEALRERYGDEHVENLRFILEGRARGLEESLRDQQQRNAVHEATWGQRIRQQQKR